MGAGTARTVMLVVAIALYGHLPNGGSAVRSCKPPGVCPAYTIIEMRQPVTAYCRCPHHRRSGRRGRCCCVWRAARRPGRWSAAITRARSSRLRRLTSRAAATSACAAARAPSGRGGSEERRRASRGAEADRGSGCACPADCLKLQAH